MDATAQIALVLDSAPDLVFATDGEGRLTSMSEAVSQALGQDAHALEGRSIFDLVHPDDREAGLAGFKESVRRRDDAVRTVEMRLLDKAGNVRIFELHRRMFFDADGALLRVEGIARDVTEHRRLEERLRRYGAIIEASDDAVAIFDRDGRFLENNPAHERLLGFHADELRGTEVGRWCCEAAATQILAALRAGRSFRGEVEARTKAGDALFVELSVFPVRGDSGDPECFVGFARDVTARKREERRRQVFQQLRERILLMRGEQDIDEVLEVLGQGLEALGIRFQNCGINLLDTSTDPPGMRSRSTRPGGGWLESEDPRGVRNVHPFWQSGAPVYRPDLERDDPYDEQAYLQSRSRIRSIVDVPFSQGTLAVNSTRPEAFSGDDLAVLEELAQVLSSGFQRIDDLRRLALSEQRYRILLETPDFVVFLLDGAGNYIYASPQVQDWLGRRPEDFYADPEIGLQLVHPDDIEAVNQALERGKAGEAVEGLEFRFRSREGHWRWASEGLYPLRGQDDSVHTIQAVIHDVTRLKTAVEARERANQELLETQAHLVQSEKMAALGNLVAGIAHEINTPVGAIHSMHDTLVRAVEKLKATMSQTYPDACREGSPLARVLKVIDESNRVIETGSARVTSIVRSLRNFARLDQAERKEADLHEGLEDSLMLIHHDIKNRIEVVRDYGDIPHVVCYPGRLNQVFLNILNNAQQAIEGPGTVTVRTRRVGNEVHVAVSDTGVGIAKDRLSRIFDPGYTTKGVGVGTGLGLSICYRIMEDHGGRIDVSSEPGKGSTFTVVVPLNPPARVGAKDAP